MAQTGYTPLLIYASGTASNVPSAANLTSSASGAELALNYADGKLFYKDSSGTVQVLAVKMPSSILPIANGGTNATATPTAGAVAYGTGTAYAFSAAGSVGQVLQSNGASAPTWVNLSTLGVSTFSAGTTGFTPSSATSGAVTLAGTLATTNGGTGLTSFTANGVVYASSSSALTTGSALTFDGTTLFTSRTTDGVIFNARGTSNAQLLLSVNSGVLQYDASNGGAVHAFLTNSTEQMRLTSTGLGIGTSSPGVKLDVSGQGRVTESGTGSGDGGFISNTGSANGNAGLLFQTNSTSRWNLTTQGTNGANLRIYNYTLGSTVATFDSSGNLGLGVTPSAWGSGFKVLNMAYATVASENSQRGQAILVSNAYNSGTANSPTWIYTNSARSLQYRQDLVDGTHAWFNAASGTAGNAITFTEAMTLDASGNLGVSVTNPQAKLDVYSDSTTAATPIAYLTKALNDSTTSNVLVRFLINYGGTGSGQINANGASAAAFGTYSDARLKENIVGLPSQLDNIMALRPVEFDYKDGSGHQTGFVAQEMQEIYPDVVAPGEDDMLMVTGWSKTEARLVKAIQELKADLDATKAELAALKGA